MIRIFLLLLLTITNAIAQPITLRIVTEDFPPFQYIRNGKIEGPMYDIMQRVCKEASIDCFIEMKPWKEALEAAELGYADVIFSVLLDVDERKEKFELSQPVVDTAYGFFTTVRNKWHFNSVDDLKGLKVGTYGPSGTSIVSEQLFKTFKSDINRPYLYIESTVPEALQNLIIGKYGKNGVIILNRDVGNYQLKLKRVVGLKFAGDIKHASYGFGFSKKSQHLAEVSRLTTALSRLRQRGIIDSILREYDLSSSNTIK